MGGPWPGQGRCQRKRGLALPCGQGRWRRLTWERMSFPYPHTPLHPGPWELTHCGWGRCGPSQTPSTASPSENPAPRSAGTRHPQHLWRSMVLGPTQACLHPRAWLKARSGRASLPASQTVLVSVSTRAVEYTTLRVTTHTENNM